MSGRPVAGAGAQRATKPGVNRTGRFRTPRMTTPRPPPQVALLLGESRIWQPPQHARRPAAGPELREAGRHATGREPQKTARYGRSPAPRTPSARPSPSPTAATRIPDSSFRTAASAGRTELPDWKVEHNKSHKQVRAREHAFARMKTWKILRDCRLKSDGVHHAKLGIARMRNLTLAGQAGR